MAVPREIRAEAQSQQQQLPRPVSQTGWGLVNLLPIWPLDGGRISRAILERKFPAALIAFTTSDIYLVLFFGLLAAGSLRAIDGISAMYSPGARR